MKRCPECLFIYPETDSRCDFDNTPLVAVDEAEIDAATKPRSRKFVFLILAVTVAFGFVVSLAYLSFARRTPQPRVTVVAAEPVTSPAPDQPSSSPSPSPSPSASPTATPKNSAERIATAHTSTTVAPISTSGPGIGKRQGARPVIVLTTGARIEADEVWRTRDGVWYRRNGLVTLLKRGQVKTIANQ